MSEANKQLIRAYVDAFNTFNVARMRELCTPDVRVHGDQAHGSFEQVIPLWQELHEGLRTRLEILSIISEGDQVAVRLRETGQFVGYFRGLAGHAPTGRTYEVDVVDWFAVKDRRIAERWGTRDSGALALEVLG